MRPSLTEQSKLTITFRVWEFVLKLCGLQRQERVDVCFTGFVVVVEYNNSFWFLLAIEVRKG